LQKKFLISNVLLTSALSFSDYCSYLA